MLGCHDESDIDHAACATGTLELAGDAALSGMDLFPVTPCMAMLVAGPHIDIINISVDRAAKLEYDRAAGQTGNVFHTVSIHGGSGNLDEVPHISRLHIDRMSHLGIPCLLDGNKNVLEHEGVGILVTVLAKQLEADGGTLGSSILHIGSLGSRVHIGSGLECIIGLPAAVEVTLVVTVSGYAEMEGIVALSILAVLGNKSCVTQGILRLGIHQIILERISVLHQIGHFYTHQVTDLIITVLAQCIVTVVGKVQSTVFDLKVRIGLVVSTVFRLGQLLPAEHLENRKGIGGIPILIKGLRVNHTLLLGAAQITDIVVAVDMLGTIVVMNGSGGDHLGTIRTDRDLLPFFSGAVVANISQRAVTQSGACNRLHAVGQNDQLQIRALLQRQIIQLCHTLGNDDGFKLQQLEGIGTDHLDRAVVRDHTAVGTGGQRTGSGLDDAVACAVVVCVVLDHDLGQRSTLDLAEQAVTDDLNG